MAIAFNYVDSSPSMVPNLVILAIRLAIPISHLTPLTKFFYFMR